MVFRYSPVLTAMNVTDVTIKQVKMYQIQMEVTEGGGYVKHEDYNELYQKMLIIQMELTTLKKTILPGGNK